MLSWKKKNLPTFVYDMFTGPKIIKIEYSSNQKLTARHKYEDKLVAPLSTNTFQTEFFVKDK